MEKIINSELENKIIDLYKSKNSLKKIATQLNCSTSYISRVLQNKGLYEYVDDNKVAIQQRSWDIEDGYEWVAQHKETKKEFFDFKNKAGTLSRYILELNPNFIMETGFKRRQYEKQNGRFWFEVYFDIIKRKKKENELKKCHYCDWTTIDLDNKSGAFTSHLRDIHNKNILEYTSEFPEEKVLFQTFFEKHQYRQNILVSEYNYIECKICGEKMKKITNSHLKKVHKITLQEYRNLHGTTLSNSSLNIIKETYDNNLKHHSKSWTSKGQNEIKDILEQNGVICRVNDKKLLQGIELDIVAYDFNLAIEYNGLLYHSEDYGKKDRNFHLNKTKLANEKNFKLIHIFEDEWVNKKTILISKLLHLFNLSKNKIHARKCEIKQINNTQRNQFLDTNHLLGDSNSTINYGAYYKDELVAIMCFNPPNKMSSQLHEIENSFELTRFCCKNNYSISGVANKLLKHFIKTNNPSHIYSFAERTWTNDETNNIYTKLGFKLTKKLLPDYKYFSRTQHNPIKLHKFQFGKQSLKKMFPNIYSDLKSEWEIMKEAKYDRIWDCGKWKYELDLS